jgi:hypothetical protein
VEISAGFRHSLAIRTDGTLVGWGFNPFGETNVPPGKFKAVAAGVSWSLGLREDGKLLAWGLNGVWGNLNVPAGRFEAISAGGFGLAIEACYADCNLDTVADIQDFGCFVNKFIAGNMYCDCNNDTVLDVADFGCFVNQFIVGCP